MFTIGKLEVRPYRRGCPTPGRKSKMAFKGLTTGMYRMKYQDWLFDVNDESDRRFADDAIAKQMNREHPTAKKIPAEDVRGIRGHYNAGRQGHAPPQKWTDVISIR